MTADLGFLRSSFDRFNDEIFGGSLPPVEIRLSRARSFLGKVEYKVRRGLLGIGAGNYAFVMRISASFDLSEAELEDVLIHEMIHYHIAVNGLRDSSTHGRLFRAMMKDINERHGRHITISKKNSPLAAQAKQGRRQYVCVCTLRDGSLGVVIPVRTRILMMHRAVSRYFPVASVRWYESEDPYFLRVRRARTPKLYRLDENELMEHLRDARPVSVGTRGIRYITDDE